MATLNQNYFDEYVKRQLMFEQLSSSQVRDALKRLRAVESNIINRLSNVYSSEFPSRRRIRILENELDQFSSIYQRYFSGLQSSIENDLGGLARSEFEFHKDFFNENLGVPVSLNLPSKEQLLTIATGNPVEGRPFFYRRVTDGGSWLSDLSISEQERFKTNVVQSFVNGDDLGTAIRNVRGTRSLNFRDGIFRTTQRNVEAVVRTGFRHLQQQAQDIVVNELGATHVRYTAVLDGRTTTICGQRDGNIYPFAERPLIPAHFNCRSTYISVFNQMIIGDRSYISDTRNRRRREIDFRADARDSVGNAQWRQLSVRRRNELISRERSRWARQNIGTAPAQTTYAQWFKGQSDNFKRNYLGTERFDLYQQNRLGYNQLINRQGSFFTIGELNQRYRNLN